MYQKSRRRKRPMVKRRISMTSVDSPKRIADLIVMGVCNVVDETENHIFFRCNVSHLFWFSSPLQLNSHDLEGADFLDCWEEFCAKIKGRDKEDEIMQEFAFGLWRIWKNWNAAVFNGVTSHPLEMLKLWRRNITEFRETKAWGKQVVALAVSRRLLVCFVGEANGRSRCTGSSRSIQMQPGARPPFVLVLVGSAAPLLGCFKR